MRKAVPSTANVERAGTPVSFSMTQKAVDWSSEHTMIEQPCIHRPTVVGREPLPSMSKTRRAPTIQRNAATQVLRGAAYDSLPALQRAISKPLVKEHKCYQVELRKPDGRCPASPPPRQHQKQRNAIEAISGRHTGACRLCNRDPTTAGSGQRKMLSTR